MSNITYQLGIQTIYKSSSIDNEPVLDKPINPIASELLDHFFQNNYDIFSEGNYFDTGNFLDGKLLKSTQTNGVVLLLDIIVSNRLTAPYSAVYNKGTYAYIFTRKDGPIQIYRQYNVINDTVNFICEDQLAPFVVPVEIFDTSSTIIKLNYFPIASSFIVTQNNTDTTATIVTPVTIDRYNGIIQIPTIPVGASSYTVTYTAVPIFYLYPKIHLIVAENNGDILTPIYLSNKTQSILES